MNGEFSFACVCSQYIVENGWNSLPQSKEWPIGGTKTVESSLVIVAFNLCASSNAFRPVFRLANGPCTGGRTKEMGMYLVRWTVSMFKHLVGLIFHH